MKDKTKLLDYAIKRINEYDGYEPKIRFNAAVDTMSACKGCELVDQYCDICPFSFNMNCPANCRYTSSGYYASEYLQAPTVKEHQDNLIKALKNWCKRFMPEYKIYRVKEQKR